MHRQQHADSKLPGSGSTQLYACMLEQHHSYSMTRSGNTCAVWQCRHSGLCLASLRRCGCISKAACLLDCRLLRGLGASLLALQTDMVSMQSLCLPAGMLLLHGMPHMQCDAGLKCHQAASQARFPRVQCGWEILGHGYGFRLLIGTTNLTCRL